MPLVLLLICEHLNRSVVNFFDARALEALSFANREARIYLFRLHHHWPAEEAYIRTSDELVGLLVRGPVLDGRYLAYSTVEADPRDPLPGLEEPEGEP